MDEMTCPRCKELEAELARVREAAEPFALAIRDDVPDDKLVDTVAWTAGQHRALAKALGEGSQ